MVYITEQKMSNQYRTKISTGINYFDIKSIFIIEEYHEWIFSLNKRIDLEICEAEKCQNYYLISTEITS